MFFQAATFRKNHCLTETVWIDVNLLLQLRCLACERQLFRQGLLISWREITSWSISKTSKAWEGRNKVGTTDNNCSASLTESTSSFQILMISSKTEMWNCRSGSLADTTNHSHRTPPIVVSLITHMDHCWNPCLPQKRTYKMKSQQAPAFVIMIIMMYTLPEIGDISEKPSHHWFATVWRSPQEKKLGYRSETYLPTVFPWFPAIHHIHPGKSLVRNPPSPNDWSGQLKLRSTSRASPWLMTTSRILATLKGSDGTGPKLQSARPQRHSK